MTGTDAFEGIAAELDYPMYVVTAAVGSERSGCLAGFGTQCSIDPVRFLICVSKTNHTHRVASVADTLVVHVLRGADRELAELFGTETGDEIDKFTRCSWQPGPDDIPVLDGLDWFAGRVLTRHDAGDHEAMVLEPFAGRHDHHAPQLGFQAVRDLDPGHDA